jgi:hypothetical protein
MRRMFSSAVITLVDETEASILINNETAKAKTYNK